MILQKILGLILILTGLFFVIAMPGIMSGPSGRYGGPEVGYMPQSFAHTIVLIGLVMLGVGIFLLVKS